MAQMIENTHISAFRHNDFLLDGRFKDLLQLIKEKENYWNNLESEDHSFFFETINPMHENSINWYPFKENANILEIGGNAGAITRCLCERANKVVSLEFDSLLGEINFERNKTCERLDVFSGDPFFFNTDIRFDYVIINTSLFPKYYGKMQENSLEKLLILAKKWKKPDGVVLLICNNRLGIRYFNGDSGNENKLFTEIESPCEFERSWNFSKNEITENLKKTGLDHYYFYYYFPDVQAPETIYSEETFSIKENENFTNRLTYRLSFFDEKKALMSLYRENIAEHFCNSFCIECSDQPFGTQNIKKIDFVKISPYRKPEFKIGTLIYSDENKNKKVIKYPLHHKALNHMKKMKEYGEQHQKKDESGFNIVSIEAEGQCGELVFTFVKGVSLEEEFIRLLKEGKKDDFLISLSQYVKMLYSGTEIISDFCNESFKAVFGPYELKEALYCKNNVNVDMIFSNIMVANEKYTVIDYEWIFDFFIPVEFIVWRAVFYLYLGHEIVRAFFSMEDLMDIIHVPCHLSETFKLWDLHFGMEFVGDQQIQKHFKEIKNCRKLLEDEYTKYLNERKGILTSIFISQGKEEGKNVSISGRYKKDRQRYHVCFSLNGTERINAIRWQPLQQPCKIQNVSVIVNDSEVAAAKAINCAKICEEWQYFITNDPEFEITTDQNSLFTLEILATIIPLDTNEIVLEYDYLMQEMRSIVNKKTMLQRIKEKSLKIIDKIKALVRPDILFYIDDIKRNETEIIIIGWAFDKESGKPVDELSIIEPEDLQHLFKYRKRNDVAAAHHLDSGSNLGYVLFCDNQKGLNTIKISIVSGQKTRLINIDLNKERKKNQKLEVFEHKAWIEQNEKEYSDEEIIQIKKEFTLFPKISIIVPVYNVADVYLREFIDSIREQYYENWELCIADDCSTKPHIRTTLEEYSNQDKRIKVYFRKENGHISKATNSAMDIATGDYIAFMDNDDFLAKNALLEYVKLINEKPDAEFIYCDEDMVDESGLRFHPFFKSNWNEKMLLNHNYITHFVMLKKELVEKIGKLDHDLNGSQDYDYVLRASEYTDAIYHIPKLLYHWRAIEGSVADDPEAKTYAYVAGKKALEKTLKRRGFETKVEIGENFGTYKVDYLMGAEPGISIIWDSPKDIENIGKLLKMTKYSNFELIVINQQRKLESDRRIKELCIESATQYDRLNLAVSEASYDYLVFLGDQMVPDSENWLKELMNEAVAEPVAVVGGKKFDSKKLTIGSGISVDKDHKRFYYPQHGKNKMDMGDYYYLSLPRFVFAVDLNFVLIRKKDFLDVNGFSIELNELNTAVDFCLKIQKHLSKKIVWTPYATAIDFGYKNKSHYASYDGIEKLWCEDDLTDPYRNNNTGIK